MAETTIEWTMRTRPDGTKTPGYTFNGVRGCTKVSAGCKNCYAETLSKRNPAALGEWGPNGIRAVASEAYWRRPLLWNREAAALGEHHLVFSASLSDVFEWSDTCQNPTSYANVVSARLRLFDLIMDTPNLYWLLLTKRPERIKQCLEAALDTCHRANEVDECAADGIAEWLERWIDGRPPENVWLGTSVENQDTADERIPHLLKVPAAVRFLSCEPLLGPVDLRHVHYDGLVEIDSLTGNHGVIRPLAGRSHDKIHWVICGGESGPHARPMHSQWARDLRDQCQGANVPYFFKQWGQHAPGSVQNGADRLILLDTGRVMPEREFAEHGNAEGYTKHKPEAIHKLARKHDEPNLLDGIRYEQFPDRPR